MRIAICASEGAPYCKSGGLGDVMEALPAALRQLEGNEVALFLPYYSRIKANPAYPTERIAQFQVTLGWRRQYCGVLRLQNRRDGVKVYFIDNEYYFGGRGGAIYGDLDDGERFAYFSRACLEAMLALEYVPDILQCNDWQTGLIPVFLKSMYRNSFPRTRVLFTIHNIEYQGWANSSFFDDVLGLPWEFRGSLDMNGSVNVMKGAIETADLVTTVSETYAKELLCAYYAHGLENVLNRNAWKLTGITNGIDTRVFNPETDPNLPRHYNQETFPEGKAAIKAALQQEAGLPVRPEVPLLVMVTRLAGHKGLDLLCYIARRLLWETDCQLLVLGTGEARFENFLRELAQQYPQQMSAKIAFQLGLAQRIYAGGDIYLMPSQSEPCGLSQLNAMRYGTVPVVHAVGGLKDTVPPVDENGNGGLGFTFQSYNADDFLAAIRRATELYTHQPEQFRALQQRMMAQDLSWAVPAGKYMDLFRQLLAY